MNIHDLDLGIKITDISKPRKAEEKLQKSLCEYISIQYPHIYYQSDPSGLRVTPGIRNILQKTRSRHAHLDIILLKRTKEFSGLIIECKRETPFLINGTLSTEKHIQDQFATMNLLEAEGFKCVWCWSLDQGIQIVNNYLGASTEINKPLF